MSTNLKLINNMDAFVETYIELNGQPTVKDFNGFTVDKMGFHPVDASVTEEDGYRAANKALENSGKIFVPGFGYK